MFNLFYFKGNLKKKMGKKEETKEKTLTHARLKIISIASSFFSFCQNIYIAHCQNHSTKKLVN